MLEGISSKAEESRQKAFVKKENKELIESIAKLQKVMYAEEKSSLLIVLQGLDASGKDGTIRSIFSQINPLGCRVKAFKKPTGEEFAHDFLWRVHKATPAKGMIKIFNRSHYEDILVPSVEGYYSSEFVNGRYDQINSFENLVEANGTKILKFYMHVSRDKQLERLQERLENPTKFWKHSDGDWSVREKWDKYIAVYEKIFERCNEVPWHIIPCDQNWNKINSIAKIILKTMEDINPQWPGLDTERFKD